MGYLFWEKDKSPWSKRNSRVNNFEKQICEFIIFLDVYSLAALTYNHMHLQGEHLLLFHLPGLRCDLQV